MKQQMALYLKGLTWSGTFAEQYDPWWIAGAKTSACAVLVGTVGVIFLAGFIAGRTI